ncbi:MAG: hypothetical protein KDA21_07825, partial [Phycisphaerales bacterium]|nr:hypothetical protein [Phycisphaerales bacterium]
PLSGAPLMLISPIRRHVPAFLLGVLVLVAGLPGVGRSQVTPVDPYFVSPVRDNVELRCLAMGTSYVVARLKSEVVLRADATDKDGTATRVRVEYPPGLPAIVILDDVSLDAGGKTLTVTRPSSLRAINVDLPTKEQSWSGIFLDQKLPIGTRLELVRALKDGNGATEAYVVKAPAGAREFVLQADVEKTTEKAYRTFMGLPARAPEGATPVVPGAGNGEQTPPPVVPVQTTPPAGDDAASGADASGSDDGAGEAGEDDATGQDPADTVAGDDTAAGLEPAPLPPHMETFRKLEDAYATVNKEPLESAEFDSLIDAYEHLDAEIPDEAENQPVRRVVASRLAMLQLRRDFQNTLFVLDQFQPPAAPGTRVEDTAPQRYTVVGRLRRSVVYDGNQLPLLYRVMSVNATDPRAGGRTLAYVRPDDKLDLPLKLNAVVGVVSTQKLDRRRTVNILEPTAVEVLER